MLGMMLSLVLYTCILKYYEESDIDGTLNATTHLIQLLLLNRE